VRDLMARDDRDARAAEAIDLFVYQAKNGTEVLTAALGEPAVHLFSSGIGENSLDVRADRCGTREHGSRTRRLAQQGERPR
jgi:acetate kinase